jgi:hypothetical protein
LIGAGTKRTIPMSTTLTVRDETPAGRTLSELSLEFLSETISVRELIRSRVYQEVQDYNVKMQTGGHFRGLVQPEACEPPLNHGADAQANHPLVDWKKQFEIATEAFEAGKVLILIDDRQAESVDETFTIRAHTTVTFLRLTLLVGG